MLSRVICIMMRKTEIAQLDDLVVSWNACIVRIGDKFIFELV